MRIVSLLPAATEIVVALGARERLVGVSHDCDYPPEIRALPRVTRTSIDSTQSSGAIHRSVERARHIGVIGCPS
jgi:iron complex transport system substrate-binding protein